MIDVNDLRRGVTFKWSGDLYRVLEYQHYKPGRGNAVIRTKLRNIRTGGTISHNFQSGDRVEDIRVERRVVQYLYNDGNLFYFMDQENYDQTPIPASIVGDYAGYLVEGMELTISSYENDPLDLDLPASVDVKVIDSEVAVAGDSATGSEKKVTIETGIQVQVPLFVQTGDTIRVDTRSGGYITRV